MQATKGRTVLYKLSSADALAIGRARAFGYIEGNTVAEGDVYPATVVQDWGGPIEVNLKVHLDGHDDFWATSRTEGSEPGTWAWPVIQAAQPKPPQLGEPVHYVSMGSPVGADGRQVYQSVCRAAYVTEPGEDGKLSLMVANPTGLFFSQDVPFGIGAFTDPAQEPAPGELGYQVTCDDLTFAGGTWHHA